MASRSRSGRTVRPVPNPSGQLPPAPPECGSWKLCAQVPQRTPDRGDRHRRVCARAALEYDGVSLSFKGTDFRTSRTTSRLEKWHRRTIPVGSLRLNFRQNRKKKPGNPSIWTECAAIRYRVVRRLSPTHGRSQTTARSGHRSALRDSKHSCHDPGVDCRRRMGLSFCRFQFLVMLAGDRRDAKPEGICQPENPHHAACRLISILTLVGLKACAAVRIHAGG